LTMIYGYARASIDGQTLEHQVEVLERAGCEMIFREKAGGARADRPQFSRLLSAVGDGDIVIVSRLDRLAGSTRNLLNTLDKLSTRGAAFRSLGEPWADTTTPHDRLTSTVFRGLAEFEREQIRARTSKGRNRAITRGQHMGRPSTLSTQQRHEVGKALAAGNATQADLARRFNVSQSTISRLADKAVLSPPIRPKIDAETERAARTFLRHLEGRYPVREAILYGSRARQTHRPDSDADIAVVLEGEHGNRWEMTRELSGIAFDVLLETGIRVQALPLWESDMKRPGQFSNPGLIENIQREGVQL
jgi:DNA invertase Pin-like site-specific DNA recombinase/predicted nucleotidyltransferase